MGDGVAVERRLVLPIGRDRVDGLEPAGVLDHDALAHQRRQRLAQALGAPEVDVGGERQLAAAYVGDERFEDVERLGQGHRPAVVVEQPEGHQGGRRDRGGGVDAVGHLERDAGHHRGEVVGLGARAGVGQRLAQRQRRTEPHVDPAAAPPLGAGEPVEPGQALGRLGPAALLGDSAETSCCWS